MENKKNIVVEQEREAFKKEFLEAVKIIRKKGIITEMDNVFTFDVFNIRVQQRIKKSNNESYLYMGDIDNLATVVNEIGDEKANEYICDLIKLIRNVLRKMEIQDYEIGKLGDEIYIYIPNVNKDKSKRALARLNQVKNSKLSICFGNEEIKNKNFALAMSKADEKMRKEKNERKLGAFSEKDISEILRLFEESIDVRLRIDKNRLTPQQKKIYGMNKARAIKQIFLEIIKGESEENEKEDKVEDELREINKKIKEKYRNKYPHLDIPEEELEVMAIERALIKMPIYGVEKFSYFEEKSCKEIIHSDPKETVEDLKNLSIIKVKIGNIKHVNDTIGHGECDKLICYVLNDIYIKAQEKGIILRWKILSNGINQYILLIDNKTSKESIQEFEEYLKTIDAQSIFNINMSSQYQLSVQGEIDKTKDSKEILLESIKTADSQATEEICKSEIDKKIKDYKLILNTMRKNRQVLKLYIEKVNRIEHEDTEKEEPEI